ncbi:MAG: helix-turn-helix domain-containing protein [Sebaldella sp.]|nr:helix-turn-helix domain-containing protein [Sebaldella sp.]
MLKSRLPELMEKKGITGIDKLVREMAKKDIDMSRVPLDKLYLNKKIETIKLETIVKLMRFFELKKIDEIVYKED